MPKTQKPAVDRLVAADMPATYSRLIARELGLTARQLPRLLRGTRLCPIKFLQEDQRISATEQLQILNNAMALSAQPDFGLRLGKRLTPSTHGAMGFVAYSSANLLSAMHAVHQFLPTRLSLAEFTLVECDDWLNCSFSLNIEMEAAVHRALSEMLAKACFEIADFVLGRAPDSAQTFFCHPAPEYRALYSHHLPGRIEFDADQLMLRFPMSLCLEPNAAANHGNYLLAMKQCEKMLAALPGQTQSYKTRVKKMMLSHPPGTLTEEEAAAALFISKRTLARKLAIENSGFRQIRDEILSQQAANYLCRNKLSVEAVAALMNYHDSANFRRAFKRWFDQPPETYRQQAGRAGASELQ